MTTLLIDADGIAYQIAAAVQTTIKWDDEGEIATTTADLGEAQETFRSTIQGILDGVDNDASVLLCWSSPTRRYFRHDLLPTYKGNRKGKPKPIVLSALIDWAKETYPAKWKDNLEADDVLGILATHPTLIKGEKIIVSGDKDLQQIPGLHISPREPGVFRVSSEYAERFFWTQVLTGDTSDNYTGIPGIGPKKADAILRKARPDEPLGELVIAAYRKHGISDEDMAVQVNVARILNHRTYDFKRKEPILWQM